jgi:AraC-like DNA-binding protein
LISAAADVGYESEAAFNRAFKKYVGPPPHTLTAVEKGFDLILGHRLPPIALADTEASPYPPVSSGDLGSGMLAWCGERAWRSRVR